MSKDPATPSVPTTRQLLEELGEVRFEITFPSGITHPGVWEVQEKGVTDGWSLHSEPGLDALIKAATLRAYALKDDEVKGLVDALEGVMECTGTSTKQYHIAKAALTSYKASKEKA